MALFLAGCATTGGGTGSGGSDTTATPSSPEFDTTAAAETAQAAIDEGDQIPNCVLGRPSTLADAISTDFDVAEDLGNDAADDGDVWSAGEVDITYCVLSSDESTSGQIKRLRIDVSPGSSIDVDTYLEEEFFEGEIPPRTSVDDFAGGTASQLCWNEGQTCGVLWQGPDLFMSVVLTQDGGTIDADAVTGAARILVPLAGTTLATGSTTGTTEVPPPPSLDTAAAASAAQAAIDLGDELGDCPMGNPAELIAATGDSERFAPGMADSTDNGQVFSGGEVDITYCALSTSDGDPGQLTDVRIDVAPGGDIDTDTYLDEEFIDPEDTTAARVEPRHEVPGGETTAVCWDEDRSCAVFWQSDDLFVSIIGTTDGPPTTVEDVGGIAETLIREAVTNLAGS